MLHEAVWLVYSTEQLENTCNHTLHPTQGWVWIKAKLATMKICSRTNLGLWQAVRMSRLTWPCRVGTLCYAGFDCQESLLGCLDRSTCWWEELEPSGQLRCSFSQPISLTWELIFKLWAPIPFVPLCKRGHTILGVLSFPVRSSDGGGGLE